MKTQIAGKQGEAAAAKYLTEHEYELISASYHCRYGEIDLIVRKKDIIVFVEVKQRKNSAFARAADNVTLSKRKKNKTTALMWLAENNCTDAARFDVVEVYSDTESINHIENAFY